MLIDPPVNPQAILFLFHPAFAPAVVQRALFEGIQGAAALILGISADVALPAHHALPHSPIFGAARRLL